MGALAPLERYRSYLETIDEESRRVADDEEYLDLLAPSEVIDLLCVRDEIAEQSLDAEQRRETDRLDDLLLKHRRLIAENIAPRTGEPNARWWWRLHEGPQVREEATRAA